MTYGEAGGRNTYTEGFPTMVIFCGLTPASRHLPPTLVLVVRADKIVCNLDFDFDFVTGVLEKLADMGFDLPDEEVAHIRASMCQGDRNLENRYFNGAAVGVDDERVEEGVIGCGWDVVSVAVQGHIGEPPGEVDSLDNPAARAGQGSGGQ